LRIFNQGVGAALVIEPAAREEVLHTLSAAGVEAWQIGTIAGGTGSATCVGSTAERGLSPCNRVDFLSVAHDHESVAHSIG
jgi:hypothetical protein